MSQPITQAALREMGFHRRVLNLLILAYWLSFQEDTGIWSVDMHHCIEVRFNEMKDDPPETARVYLHIVKCMAKLEHVKTIEDLKILFRLLSGKEI